MSLVLELSLLAVPVVLVGYAYLAYPLLLGVVRNRSAHVPAPGDVGEWPLLTVTVPAYNEAGAIGGTLERILELDYPPDRRQVLVVSDASSDGTDEIVRRYADRGVELVRLPVRGGKTAAENAARLHIRGEIVVNTDASVRLHRDSLKPLIAVFADPTIGVASGRDVSVARLGADANAGESGYVGYEMWVRDLETAAGGIVGASGCYYASRRDLHEEIVPAALSRDFAAPLIAHEHGFRSVSVRDAVCFVPRQGSLRMEYRRKVRTMSRGLQTLFYKRHLMNPFRHGRFAWMLLSHKLARWLVPWGVVCGVIGGLLLSARTPALAATATLGVVGVTACALIGWFWSETRLPRPVALIAYLAWGILAGLQAWINAARGDMTPTWEPTRREVVDESE